MMVGSMYWIEGPWPGRVAIVARPRGGEWLADEIHQWRQAGLNGVVSLLTSSELSELDLQSEQELVGQAGLQFFTFPILDRSIPSSMWEMRRFVEQLHAVLAAGKHIGIHCRQSIGRSALLAASLLVHAGLDVETAFERVQVARGCAVPETAEQREWVERFAALEAIPVLQ
jgi:protein-tyrosine phosphatase